MGEKGGNRTEPWALSEPYESWSRNAIHNRLQFSRQLYTCLYGASRDGDTCFDPLTFHFGDEAALEDIEHTFIFANALKVSPVLEANATEVKSYFPAGRWVSVNNMSDVVEVACPEDMPDCYGVYGEYVNLTVSADTNSTIHSHIKPGSFLAFQDNSEQKFSLTSDILKQPVSLIANRDHHGHAEGLLFLDDGISQAQLYDNTYEYYNF